MDGSSWTVAGNRVDPRELEGVYPLSPAQKGILFQALYAEGDLYVVQVELELAGTLSLPALEQAWRAVIARHPALRTSFHWEDLDKPLQVVRKEVPFALDVIDERHAPPGAHAARLARERRTGFDLAKAPCLRARVILLDGGRHALEVAYHHIAADAWSMKIVVGEVLALHDAALAGKPLTLPPVRAYRELIAWLEALPGDETRRYWRGRLAGVRATTPLPYDRAPLSRPDPGDTYAELERSFDDAALRAACAKQRVTLGTAIHAAWALLLGRHAGEGDVVFGGAVDGRSIPLEGVEQMVGLFLNTLPVRVTFDATTTTGELLRRVQADLLGARAHEQSQLTDVRAASELAGDAPLFESILVFQNVAADEGGAPAEGLRPVRGTHQENSGFPLTLVVDRFGGGALSLLLAYNTRRFARADVERLLAQLVALLESFAANPELPVRAHALAGATERKRLLQEWNPPPAAPSTEPLHATFEAQVDRAPDAIALRAGDVAVSYRALDDDANRLAHHLIAQGVAPGDRVAIVLPASIPAITAMLAALKCGAAYLPIDPDAPADRIAFLLRDAGVKVAFTDGAAVTAALAGQPATRPRIAHHPERPAYVVYTSGSTGEPKGVVVPHRAVVNHGRAVARRFELSPGDRMLQFTPLHFDAAVEEIFPVLLAGATTVLHGELIPVDEFSPLIDRLALTILSMPPAYVHAWLSHVEREGGRVPRGLRRVILGGEAILPQTRAMWERLGGDGIPWFNVYGPTEGTVTSSMERLLGPLDAPAIPMGRPIDNVQIFLVDEDLAPVPVRMPGEICLAGLGLAHGYLGRPDLTADKFVPNPFATTPGARMYRTGDRAQFLPDGRLMFLGRVDRQVKIRGARVELGEVEAAFARHPAVQEVAAVARDEGGDRRLVAYVVAKTPGAVDAIALRAHATKVLPEYMAPSAYVLLDALPLTSNGKVDFRALPAPVWGASADAFVAPEGPLEAQLAGIFAEVLRVPLVSRHAPFFDLGGHSLLALQAVARIRRDLGKELPLKTLYDEPTVAGLARALGGAATAAPTAAITRQPRDGRTFPLSSGQEQMWLLHTMDPGSLAYSIPLKLRIEGPLVVDALAAALRALVERHEVLRTTYGVEDGRPVQRIHPVADVLAPIIDLSTLAPDAQAKELARLAKAETDRPFDLQRGPVMRATLVRQHATKHALLLTLHHIVFDGWSTLVLTQDLSTLYEAAKGDAKAVLAPLELQVADHAVWERTTYTQERLAKDLDWWRGYLDGMPDLMPLPLDRERPAVRSRANRRVHFQIPADVADGLRKLARRDGATTFAVVLAAFGQLLQRYSGEDRLTIGTIATTRDRPEVEALIGYFVNQTPVQLRDLRAGTVRELVRRTHDDVTAVLDHRHVPFQNLVELVNPERNPSYAPLVQVAMQFDSTPEPEEEIFEGLTFEEFDPEPGEVVYDLLLHVEELGRGPMNALFGYAIDVFDPKTIERLSRHLLQLLRGFVAREDAAVVGLELVTPAERAQLLDTWNAPPAAPTAQQVHELFEAQAARTPDAPAIVELEGKARVVTYRELLRLAGGLAARLTALGVGPETPVGLLCNRSADAIAAIYGVLMAGGAYVPMDVSAPADRLRYITKHLGIQVVLADAALVEGHAELAPHVLPLDRELASVPAPLASTARGPQDRAAYVVFTSGTTGDPKGVLVPHRAVVNHNREIADALGLGPADRLLQFTPLNFDAAGEEIFPPLCRGGAVVIAPEHVDFAGFGPLLEQHQVSVASLPPAFAAEWLLWLELNAGHVPRSLRLVILGGEKIPPEAYARWRRLGGAEIPWINVYGPTETTVTAAMGTLVPGDLARAAFPIGRPVRNAQLFVLDPQLRLCPQGQTGELYIGGLGLARGYQGLPAETAERFIPHPFASTPGERLYRTGDLTRQWADGQLEVLGRADHQVKIRGHRIELGEIEAVLHKIPEVASAIAVARDDLPGGRGLAAYVVPQPWAQPDPWDLRRALEAKLPRYMVPAAINVIGSIPLTRGGKVDLRSLPAPVMPPPRAEAPQELDELAGQIAALWASALAMDEVALRDDFFDLGGHSLLLMQLVTKVDESLGIKLEVARLYDDTTLAGMVAAVRAAQARGATRATNDLVVPLAGPDGEPTAPPLFLVHTAGGDVTCFVPLARALGHDRRIYGLSAGPLGVDDDAHDFEALARRYVDAIRHAQPTGPYAIAGHSYGSFLAYEIARQLTEAGDVPTTVVLLDTLSPSFLRTTFPEEIGVRDASKLDFPDEWSSAQAAAYKKRMWHHLDLSERWTPRPYAGPLLVLGCAANVALEPGSLGWKAHAALVELEPSPGDHVSMLAPPHVAAVAAAIARTLTRPA